MITTDATHTHTLTAKSSYGPTENCDASMLTFAALAHDATMVVLGGARVTKAETGVLGVCSVNGILRDSAFDLAVPLHNWHKQWIISHTTAIVIRILGFTVLLDTS